MSKTPRTDAVTRTVHTSYFMGAALSAKIEVVDAKVAQELETELAEAQKRLSAIMEVIPDDAKPSDAPELIKFFKAQMSAYASRGIELEKQLKEARAEIERKDTLVEQMREALKDLINSARTDAAWNCWQPNSDKERRKAESDYYKLLESVKLAEAVVEAAERIEK